MVRAHSHWFARLLAEPLPHLAPLRLVREHDEVLKVILGNELVQLDPDGVLRNGIADEHDNAALFSNGLEAILGAIDLLGEGLGELVPAQFLNKKLTNVEILEALP